MKRWQFAWWFIIFILAAAACVRPAPVNDAWQLPQPTPTLAIETQAPTAPVIPLPPTRQPGAPILSPTPDSPHTLPTQRVSQDEYIVQPGDTLGNIAIHYNIDLTSLITANELVDPNRLEVGQVLKIPAPTPSAPGPDFKIIPDSELVYSPASATFDLFAYIQSTGGYLANAQEKVDDVPTSGADIVARISREYSVNPRILLAVLEYQSGWVTQAAPAEETRDFPMRYPDPGHKGLYLQLAWAANNLNRGYYLWNVNAISRYVLTDGSLVPPGVRINSGTAGVQYLFSLLTERAGWNKAVSEKGVFAVYSQLFGYPFDFALDRVLPLGLRQPVFQLPFEPGQVWSFTGGPHGGWGDGSAWAALDFAPPGDALGCVQSDAWVVAVADGLIIRASNGAVVQDLDGDGIEQTGWTVLYMHIESRDRVPVGKYLSAGERIGHSSCEGGVSNGTHVHLARRYNGEWIPADGSIPFVLDGWISQGTGKEYDGTLVREGQVVEAWDSRKPENQIQR